MHISLLALPDAAVSTLAGLYDVMRAAGPAFNVQIVGETAGSLALASGVPIEVQRPIEAIDSTDIVIASSMWVQAPGWRTGRYPMLVAWLKRMHERGALLCSACSGVFLLAETGLFDSMDATVHFDYADWFRAAYPAVRVHP